MRIEYRRLGSHPEKRIFRKPMRMRFRPLVEETMPHASLDQYAGAEPLELIAKLIEPAIGFEDLLDAAVAVTDPPRGIDIHHECKQAVGLVVVEPFREIMEI